MLSQRTRRVKKLNSRDVTAPCPERTGRLAGVRGGVARKAAWSLGTLPVGGTGDPRPGCQWSASASARPCRDRRWSAAGEAPARGQFSLVSSFSSPPGVHSDPQLQPSPRRRAELGCAVLMSGSTPPKCQELRSCSSCPPRLVPECWGHSPFWGPHQAVLLWDKCPAPISTLPPTSHPSSLVQEASGAYGLGLALST